MRFDTRKLLRLGILQILLNNFNILLLLHGIHLTYNTFALHPTATSNSATTARPLAKYRKRTTHRATATRLCLDRKLRSILRTALALATDLTLRTLAPYHIRLLTISSKLQFKLLITAALVYRDSWRQIV